MGHIGRVFFSGLLAAMPLALTAFVTGWLLSLVNDYFGPGSVVGRFLRSLGIGVGASEAAPYMIGLALMIAAIYSLGLLVESRAGPWFSALVAKIVRRIPVVSHVYDLSTRFTAILDTRNGDSLKNMSPAWCYFGGKPGAAVLALLPTTKPIRLGGEDYIGVLVPSAPVPFGGALLYVPASWVELAEEGIDELMSIYVSMGMTQPASQPRQPPGVA